METKRQLLSDHCLVTHTVSPKMEGIRLDAFLKLHYKKRSREELKKAISKGIITIQRSQSPHLMTGKPKPSSLLIAGDEVMVLTKKGKEPTVSFDYRVIYEDEAILVVDKPPNLPVHPAGRYFFNTLLTHLQTKGFTQPLREDRDFFLVHRIDKETSGLMVLAKQARLCDALISQFAERKTKKTYLAMVHGHPPETFKVDLPLGKDPHSAIKLKMAPVSLEEGGQSALTVFETLNRFHAEGKEFALVRCYPKTGRQHQIRVHLHALGFPLVGDKIYGLEERLALRFFDRTPSFLTPELQAKLILPRHALHAHSLSFLHPETGNVMEFVSELPKDLKEFLEEPTPRAFYVDDTQTISAFPVSFSGNANLSRPPERA